MRVRDYYTNSKLKTFVFICIGIAGILTSCKDPEPKPNVILLMGDDHGWDETGYNGHPYLR